MDLDEEMANRLAEAFYGRRDEVEACDQSSVLTRRLQAKPSVDLVVLDVTLNDARAWNRLAELCKFRKEHGPAPAAICISRAHHGARFELEVERKGTRLVYVR